MRRDDVAPTAEALHRAARAFAESDCLTAMDRADLGLVLLRLARIAERHRDAPRACVIPAPKAWTLTPEERNKLGVTRGGEAA